MADPFSAGAGGSGGNVPATTASASGQSPDQRQFYLPDTLRPQTVGWFAPYWITILQPSGADSGVVFTPNPWRVGVLFGVTGLASGKVSFSVYPGDSANVIFRVGNDEEKSGMLADLFSLCMAGWKFDAPAACTITAVEFVRKPQ